MMVENVPVLKHVHDGLTIEGYSRAAVQTCWRVNELKLLFDVGVQPWDFMGTSTMFITHAHLDHIAALPAYVSRRRMMKMDPPVIYLPDSAVDTAWEMLQMFRKLDRGAMPCELVGLLARRRNAYLQGVRRHGAADATYDRFRWIRGPPSTTQAQARATGSEWRSNS